MKRLVSGSSILLLTALMFTLSFGCGEGTEGDTGSQSAQLTNGQCNAIVASSLGLSQQCNQFGCSADECLELLATLGEFFNPELNNCAELLVAGKLNGLGGNALWQGDDPSAGDPKHIQEVICGAAEACDPACPNVQAVGLCLDTEACP
jgi:hypothetical protein